MFNCCIWQTLTWWRKNALKIFNLLSLNWSFVSRGFMDSSNIYQRKSQNSSWKVLLARIIYETWLSPSRDIYLTSPWLICHWNIFLLEFPEKLKSNFRSNISRSFAQWYLNQVYDFTNLWITDFSASLILSSSIIVQLMEQEFNYSAKQKTLIPCFSLVFKSYAFCCQVERRSEIKIFFTV